MSLEKEELQICGIINIHKEKGFSSHDVVNVVRKTLDRIKTGHTGTLDPLAEGVLPICIGKATKISDYISSDIKKYRAELTLGTSTSTQDSTGEVIISREVSCSKEEIESAVLSFKGEISQTPPMYSAIKIDGVKLYELARKGKEVERKSRNITIYEIEIVEFIDYNKVVLDVLCSKGTYIRALCNDIGEKLGCGGHMSSLLRTRAGNFYLEKSIKLDELKKIVSEGNLEQILMPVDEALNEMQKIKVLEEANKYLYNGNKINARYIMNSKLLQEQRVLVYDFKDRLIGIYEFNDGFIKPLTMLVWNKP